MRQNIQTICERTTLKKIIKVKNSLLELDLGKDFAELEERLLKDREVKIKREIRELIFKPVFVSIDDVSLNKKK